MNLNQPMGWEAFKGMPNDLQKEYVKKCVDTFGCTKADFGLLFDVTPMTISRAFEKIGIDQTLFVRGRRMPKESARNFREWMSKSDAESPGPESVPISPDSSEHGDLLSSSSSLRVTFDGSVDYASVLKVLYQFAKDDPVRLTIFVRREQKHE